MQFVTLKKHKIIELIDKYNLEYQNDGFSSWDHLMIMVYSQIAHLSSLRSIVATIGSQPSRYHVMGLSEIPNRSTIAYANSHRNWVFFQDVFNLVYKSVKDSLAIAGVHSKLPALDNDTYFIDATVIDVSLSLFEWARYRTAKGGFKIHNCCDKDLIPQFAIITPARTSDVSVLENIIKYQENSGTILQDSISDFDAVNLQNIHFPRGSVLCFDRGYLKFSLLYKIDSLGLFYVTRAKTEMAYEVVQENVISADLTPINPDAAEVIKDQIIRFKSKKAQDDYPDTLRLITAVDNVNGITYRFLTNLLDPTPDVISAVYKARWSIEVFFKTIKQRLVVTNLLGVSTNAVKIQIFSAMIALVIALYHKLIAKIRWDLSSFFEVIRTNLFHYIDLVSLRDNPLTSHPPPPDGIEQNKLF
jgi:hypothetical protein